MTIEQLTKDQVADVYQTHLCLDFPPDERKPLDTLFKAMDAGKYECYALTENADTPGGVTRAADLDSYLLPTALDMCPVRTVLLEEGAGVPPLLVHGIGEPATSIVAPAITNAMSAALGARIDTLPADLETVRAILDEKKR